MLSIVQEGNNACSFHLKTEKGHVLLTSIPFLDEAEMRKNIAELSSKGKYPIRFERKTNTSGEFLFSILNSNRQIIGNSQLYSSEAGMENGIKNLKKRISSLSLSNIL